MRLWQGMRNILRFFVFSGFCESSFSAVSANFLTSTTSFFSAFHALSDGRNPEYEKLKKKLTKMQFFQKSIFLLKVPEIWEIFRNFHQIVGFVSRKFTISARNTLNLIGKIRKNFSKKFTEICKENQIFPKIQFKYNSKKWIFRENRSILRMPCSELGWRAGWLSLAEAPRGTCFRRSLEPPRANITRARRAARVLNKFGNWIERRIQYKDARAIYSWHNLS